MSEAVRLIMAYPISANRYWRSFVLGKRVMTAPSNEAKAYRSQIAWSVKEAGCKMIRGRVAIDIELYPHRPLDWEKRAAKAPLDWDNDVRCIDLDNANKVLLDAIKGVLIEDDKWVWRMTARRMEPDAEGERVVMTVTPIALAHHPQAALFPGEKHGQEALRAA